MNCAVGEKDKVKMMLYNLFKKTLKLYLYDFIFHTYHYLEPLQTIKISLTPFCIGMHENSIHISQPSILKSIF